MAEKFEPDKMFEKLEEELEKELQNGKPNVYVSREGFEKVRIIRGFSDIHPLWLLFEGRGVYFCGGHIRWMCSPLKDPVPGCDIDIYCENDTAFEFAENVLKDGLGLEVKWSNDMSTGFKRTNDPENMVFPLPSLNLIRPITEGAVMTEGDKEAIISNFDFTVVRICLDSIPEQTALADADFLHDEEKQLLRFKNIHCPISSVMRACKYSKKGYYLPPFQALSLFFDWDDRDDEYRIKLQDFLKQAEKEEGLTEEEVHEMEKMMRID